MAQRPRGIGADMTRQRDEAEWKQFGSVRAFRSEVGESVTSKRGRKYLETQTVHLQASLSLTDSFFNLTSEPRGVKLCSSTM